MYTDENVLYIEERLVKACDPETNLLIPSAKSDA
jgi:hypothetical protein